MKILNISSHIDGYGLIVNNCIDYNIAGAASFYKKDFLKLYCILWGLYSNYSIIPIDTSVTNVVLNDLGLQLKYNENISKKNIISQIKHNIDNHTPTLLAVNHTSLFYSIMYKELNNVGINHNIIIHGYDDEKEILYIKENSINTEILDALCKNKIFSSYKITYDMLINFYTNTKKILKRLDYNNFCLYYIQKYKDINLSNLKKKIILSFLEALKNSYDSLQNEIGHLDNVCLYNSYYRSEQFRRKNYYSLIPLFDFLKEELFLENETEFQNLKNEFLSLREKIINVLAKYSYLNKKVETKNIKEFQCEIKKISDKLYSYIESKYNNINNINYSVINEVNYIEDEETILMSDSEDERLVLNNIRNERSVNNNLSFWKSSENMDQHWIIIDFQKLISINKIIIEHHSFAVYITKHFSIYGLNDKGWSKLEDIKDNRDNINCFYYKNPEKFSKIKITIEKPNYGIDYAARIKLIKIF